MNAPDTELISPSRAIDERAALFKAGRIAITTGLP